MQQFFLSTPHTLNHYLSTDKDTFLVLFHNNHKNNWFYQSCSSFVLLVSKTSPRNTGACRHALVDLFVYFVCLFVLSVVELFSISIITQNVINGAIRKWLNWTMTFSLNCFEWFHCLFCNLPHYSLVKSGTAFLLAPMSWEIVWCYTLQ